MQPAAEEEEQNAMQLDGEDVTSDNEDSATVNRKRELRASYRELGQEAVGQLKRRHNGHAIFAVSYLCAFLQTCC